MPLFHIDLAHNPIKLCLILNKAQMAGSMPESKQESHRWHDGICGMREHSQCDGAKN